MKKGIHPKWHHDCVVTCSCGNSFTTGSTMKTMQIDICDQCHPYFTGEMKFVDRQGRVDKFLKKMKLAQKKKKVVANKKSDKRKQKDEKQLSYKQILQASKSKINQSDKQDKKKKTTNNKKDK